MTTKHDPFADQRVAQAEKFAFGQKPIWTREDQVDFLDRYEITPAITYAQEYGRAIEQKWEDQDLLGEQFEVLCGAATSWLVDYTGTFEFVLDVRKKWFADHSVSIPALRGILNCIRADVSRAAKAAIVAEEAGGAFREGFPRIVKALHAARQHALDKAAAKPGAKRASASVTATASILLPVGERIVKLSIAGETSRYTGDIHVAEYIASKDRTFNYSTGEYEPKGDYYGRLDRQSGEVSLALEKHPDILAILRDLEAHPSEKIREYSRLLGKCAICGATLSNERSIAAGIGPICAGKVGW